MMRLLASIAAQGKRIVWALWWVALLIIGGFVLFTRLPDDMEVYTDPTLLLYVALAYTVAGLVMLAYTRDWDLIGRGMLVTITGDALLYLRTVVPLIAERRAFWRGQDWFLELAQFLGQHWVTDVIRSCFLVGSSLFLLGVGGWVRREWRLSQSPERPP